MYSRLSSLLGLLKWTTGGDLSRLDSLLYIHTGVASATSPPASSPRSGGMYSRLSSLLGLLKWTTGGDLSRLDSLLYIHPRAASATSPPASSPRSSGMYSRLSSLLRSPQVDYWRRLQQTRQSAVHPPPSCLRYFSASFLPAFKRNVQQTV